MKTSSKDIKQIASVIREEDPETRGELLYAIAEELRNQSQGFTSLLFTQMANVYGHNLKKDTNES
jgi:hypothetical protein